METKSKNINTADDIKLPCANTLGHGATKLTCGQRILANMNALHKGPFSSFQSNLHDQASLCAELNYQSLTKVITICSAVYPPVIPGWPEYSQHVDTLHFAILQRSGQLYF